MNEIADRRPRSAVRSRVGSKRLAENRRNWLKCPLLPRWFEWFGGFADRGLRTTDYRPRTTVLTGSAVPHSVRDVHMKHRPEESGSNVVGRGVAEGYLADEEVA